MSRTHTLFIPPFDGANDRWGVHLGGCIQCQHFLRLDLPRIHTLMVQSDHTWLAYSMSSDQFEQQAQLAYEHVRPATFLPYIIGYVDPGAH